VNTHDKWYVACHRLGLWAFIKAQSAGEAKDLALSYFRHRLTKHGGDVGTAHDFSLEDCKYIQQIASGNFRILNDAEREVIR